VAHAKDPEFVYLRPDDDTAYTGPELASDEFDTDDVVIEYKRIRRVRIKKTTPMLEGVK
jgi:hypothetical protein